MLLIHLGLQVVLAFPAGPAPVRFGAPVPEQALAKGLGLQGEGALQWRFLPLARRNGRRWIEVAVAGAGGTVRVHAGGRGPSAGGDGAAFVRADDSGPMGDCTTTWTWCDGSVDRRQRTVFAQPTVIADDCYDGGEARTEENANLPARCGAVAALPARLWEEAGLLPPDQGLGRSLRSHLQTVAHALVELPGARGAGDFARSGGVVTNLEFDTTLALLRLGLALQDEDLLLRARRCAMHLVDRDLDPDSGLPFPHGPGHRSGWPEPGHCWLRGLLWAGAVCADDRLLAAATQIAHALAAIPPSGEGRRERARDFAWPLLELEAYLELKDDPAVAAAADRLAAAIALRFDERARTFRFGEGEVGGGVYFERGWLLGGIVLPALQAHLRRRPDRELQRHVGIATQGLLDQIGLRGDGLPTHWRRAGSATFAEHRAVHDPKAFLLLEALPPAELRRLLRRERLWQTLRGTPALDDPDLPTSFTMVARCTWIYR